MTVGAVVITDCEMRTVKCPGVAMLSISGKLQPLPSDRQPDAGKDDLNVRPCFEDGNGRVGVSGFNSVESVLADHPGHG